MKPWDKLKGETDRAYGGFEIYLDSSKFERSDIDIAKACGADPSTIYKWSIEYNWDERARAWDSVIVDAKHEIIKEHQSERYLKRFEDRIKAEERASDALEDGIDVMISIVNNDSAALNHRIAAFREVKALTHIDDIDLTKQVTEQDSADALALLISEAPKKLDDEKAATLRDLIAELRQLNE